MNPPYRLQFLALLLAQLLAACTNPISRQALEHVDPTTTLALVSENPSAYLDRKLLLGGAVIVLESEESGSLLEIME